MPNSAGVEIARLSVKVSPDSKSFRRDLKRDLEEIERSMTAQIDVEPDMKGFRSQVSAITKGMSAKIKLDVDKSAIDQLRDAAKSMDKASSGGFGSIGGGGLGSSVLIAVAALAAAGPLVGVLSTSLAALPGLLSAVAVPIGAMALGIDGIKTAAEGLAVPFNMLRGIMAANVAQQFTPVFEQLGTIFPMLGRSLPAVTQGMADLFAGFTNVITSSGGMARIESTIGNISTALSAASPGVQLFTNGLLGLADELSQKLPAVSQWFNELGADFSSWMSEMSESGTLSAAFDGLGATVKEIVNTLLPILQQGIDFMADPDKVLALQAAIKTVGALIQGAVAASSGFFEMMSQIAYFIVDSGNTIVATWRTITTAVQAGVQTITSVASSIGAAFSGAWNGITATAQAVWNGVVSSVQSAVSSVVSSITSGGASVLAEVGSWPGRIAGALAGLASEGAAAGAALVQGLINGIGNMIGSAVAKARELASSVAGAVKGFLGINSPSKLFTEYGEWTAEGFGNGLVSGFEPVISQAKTLAEQISKAFEEGTDLSGVLGPEMQNLKATLDSIEQEKKRLKVEKNALVAEDKEGRKALQNQIDQLQAQKDMLSYQRERLDNEEKYSGELGSTSGDDPLVNAVSGLMNSPVNFAKATGQQFMSDLGIRGDGLISKLLTEGTQYVFNIGSVDEALSIKDREEAAQALTIVGRQ